MNKDLDYRKRNLLLWASASVVLLLSYLLAFSKTINLYSENSRLEDRIEIARNAPEQVKELEREAFSLQKQIHFLGAQEDFRQEVRDLLSHDDFAQGVILKSMKSPVSYRSDDMQIETYEIAFQGAFIPLVKTIYRMEQKMTLGRVAGVKMQVERDKSSRKEILIAYVYIQTSRNYDQSNEAF